MKTNNWKQSMDHGLTIACLRAVMNTQAGWPELPYENWKETHSTLHRWLQIVGKVRLVKTPWMNHSWHSTFYLTARGLTTGLIHEPERAFSMDFDFIDHLLQIRCSDGRITSIPLRSEPVARFYDRCFKAFSALGIEVTIHTAPNELPDVMRLDRDEVHRTYDPEAVHRFWQILLHCERVMQKFRSKFVGKVSPIHLFWGSFDLAATRFSGRKAPPHPGGVPHLPDLVVREAYSHEVSSCGFWPGNDLVPFPAFYSYCYPVADQFGKMHVKPNEAFYHEQLREFILPYEVVRTAESPDSMLLEFFQSTYEAAAQLGKWDRELLEESSILKELQAKQAGSKKKRASKRAA
jgi:hypothetical protein